MFSLPQFKQIKEANALQSFSDKYLKASGLPIPETYLGNSKNRVFGIYWKQELIGGFILGNGSNFRTIKYFAHPERQEEIYKNLEDHSLYTEITCFWIKRTYRTKSSLNFFIWFAMAYALRRYGSKYFLFGTCSRSLARLYSQTQKSILISRDFVNRKTTFIFFARRSECLQGMFEIILHKFNRVFRVSKKVKRSVST